MRRALVSAGGALINIDASSRVLLVGETIRLSGSIESSFAGTFVTGLAVSWDTSSKWVTVVSASSADSKRIVSNGALVFTDLVDTGLSINTLVSSSFAFVDVDATLWSIRTVGELSTVLSVSVSVVTGDAVAVVASLSVGRSADGHRMALVGTEGTWTLVSKTGVRTGDISAVFLGGTFVFAS